MNTTLKVGDKLTYEGIGCRVSRADAGFIRIVNREGYSNVIENPVPEVFVQEPSGHCPELSELLSQFAVWGEEFKQPISESQKESAIMKTQGKKTDSRKPSPRGGLHAVSKQIEAEQSGNPHGGLTAAAQIESGSKAGEKAAEKAADAALYAARKAEKEAAKKAKAEAKANKPTGSASGVRTGRARETRILAHDLKMTVEEIHAVIKPKFSTADISTTRRIVESERANGRSTAS